MKPYIPVLKKCPLFKNIDDIETTLKHLHPHQIHADKKKILFAEGDPAHSIGIVLNGSIQILRNDFYGNQTIIERIYPSSLFAETFVCAGIQNFPVTVETVEESDVLMIDVRTILEAHSDVQLLSNLLSIMANKNILLNNKLTIMSKRSTKEKIMTYLKRVAKKNHSSDFCIPYNRQELADYLGVERSALSAELSRLKKQGILNYKKNHFTLYMQNDLNSFSF